MIKTEICIVGAGPGGAGAALQLAYKNIPSVLIDKATFPRDKICGDALSGKVVTVLNRMDPQILRRFRGEKQSVGVWGLKFVVPDLQELNLVFKNDTGVERPSPGLVATRMDFDDFLIRETRRHECIQMHEEVSIDHYEKTEEGYLLSNKAKTFQVACKVLIVANGAHSAFTRHHAGLEKDNKHYAGGIRAYYKNVGGIDENSMAIELHYLKELVPGYLWIFPLPDGKANVGLGMRSDKISERKFNMKKSLLDILENHPKLSQRFKNAELIGDIKGFGLPLGSKKRNISGDHYMLVGDAGHLIDPLTGEGIGNALYSGVIAADQAIKCLEANTFSAKFMLDYDRRVQRVMGKELRISHFFQRIMFYPRVVNFMTRCVTNNSYIQNFLNRIYADSETEWHKEMKTMKFWYKFVFNRD